MKKIVLIALALIVLPFEMLQAQQTEKTKIIAHRGYWAPEGCAQNALSALKKAQEFKAWGSEFDVNMTADGKIVISHGPKLEQLPDVQEATYKQVKKVRLSKSGEKVPTLKQFLKQGKKYPDTKLIFELKEHKTPEQETQVIERALKMIDRYKMRDQIVFISFSLHALKEMVKRGNGIPVQSLISAISPKELYKMGINAVDYNYKVFREHPQWYKDARDFGMKVNVWTVSTKELIEEAVNLGVDYITTDNPELAREIIK